MLAEKFVAASTTAPAGEDAIVRELWADFVTSYGRPEDEIEAGLRALESVRAQVDSLGVSDLRQQFEAALPPSVEVLRVAQ